MKTGLGWFVFGMNGYICDINLNKISMYGNIIVKWPLNINSEIAQKTIIPGGPHVTHIFLYKTIIGRYQFRILVSSYSQ